MEGHLHGAVPGAWDTQAVIGLRVTLLSGSPALGELTYRVAGGKMMSRGSKDNPPLTCSLRLGWGAAESWEMGACTASPLTHVWSRGALYFPKPVFFTCDRETKLPVSQSFSED